MLLSKKDIKVKCLIQNPFLGHKVKVGDEIFVNQDEALSLEKLGWAKQVKDKKITSDIKQDNTKNISDREDLIENLKDDKRKKKRKKKDIKVEK